MKQEFLNLYTNLNEEELSNITGGYWAHWADEGINPPISSGVGYLAPIGTGKR
ncbi:bacteriocin [Leuconostoc lactis]|uniref:bacteriocin n=1 Tax=Leuconostoc lactis TaxID=1246 RepID=UPI001022904F|nr:bacteriocin [Leuconostoc lactis]MSB65620.1 bacteriocin [Leuconostoc lactis]RYS84434.1 bacteriocin [Leuconostoc lactis]